MTDDKELAALCEAMRKAGAHVRIVCGRDGLIISVQINDAPPRQGASIGPFPMTPISAAERMRAYLHAPPPRGSLSALLREAMEHQHEAFDTQEEVDGADLVDWFAEWRHRVIAALQGSVDPGPVKPQGAAHEEARPDVR